MKSALPWVLFALLATLAWCLLFQRFPGEKSFKYPSVYENDAMYFMGVAKGFSELPPPWDIRIRHLNAPDSAGWNDYPLTEKLLYYTHGLLARYVRAGVASNITYLLAHVTAAISFLWAARRLGAGWLPGMLGGLLFAFSPYMMWRAYGHLNLLYVWPVPVLFVLLHFLWNLEGFPRPRIWLAGFAAVGCFALLSPYYFLLSLQLLLLTALGLIVRGNWRAGVFGSFLATSGTTVFLLNQLNVFLAQAREGKNFVAGARILAELELYGLRIPDLLLPRDYPLGAVSQFLNSLGLAAGGGGESGAVFLGVAGVAALCCLLAYTAVSGFRNPSRIPLEFWVAAYTAAFAVVGGLNYLLGSLGFVMLRAGSRYSIVILCAALLFCCRSFHRIPSRAMRGLLLAVIFLAGAAEVAAINIPARRRVDRTLFERVDSDRAFTRELESKLPAAAMVFQLPVVAFPEVPPVHGMQDYEHFRPYVWSKALRFSYGAHKGRLTSLWQASVVRQGPDVFLPFLEACGFDALMINTAGYPDKGAALENDLARRGCPVIVRDRPGSLVAYRLTPRHNGRPASPPVFLLSEGWWDRPEANADAAWAKGTNSDILLHTPRIGQPYVFECALSSLCPQNIKVSVEGREIAGLDLQPGQESRLRVDLKAEHPTTRVRFLAAHNGQAPGNGDPRRLSFQILHPQFRTGE
jgi:phosphoglycerol transferase